MEGNGRAGQETTHHDHGPKIPGSASVFKGVHGRRSDMKGFHDFRRFEN